MKHRFDMQNKTSQQRIIVAKKDAENERMQQEAARREAEKKNYDDVNPIDDVEIDDVQTKIHIDNTIVRDNNES